MNPKTQKMVSDCLKLADEAAQKWVAEQHDVIEDTIKVMLDKRLDEIVGKMLGFDLRWGTWEVDHCNGRAGESAAGDWLRQRAGLAVMDWLDKQAKSLLPLPAKAAAALRTSYQEQLEDELRRDLMQKARQDAKDLLNAGLKGIVE